jgi:transcriptional regulator with PAS, ATPase and Fis domain
LLAATNRDLGAEVAAGHFREDLYYRINVLTVMLPPLREREGDLPLLVREFTRGNWQMEPDFLPTLARYRWPGNVRQLLNAIERAKVLAENNILSVKNLPPEVSGCKPEAHPTPVSVDLDLEMVNKMHIEATYLRYRGNKARTARALGIGRRSLYRMLEKYGIAEVGAEV